MPENQGQNQVRKTGSGIAQCPGWAFRLDVNRLQSAAQALRQFLTQRAHQFKVQVGARFQRVAEYVQFN